jgi:Reverse transcriptase (RNA-dependent DNA polymerase)
MGSTVRQHGRVAPVSKLVPETGRCERFAAFGYDRRIIRLIQKWLKAGVLEDGIVTVSDKGTGQGSVISPLLANLYLHYVFDLWAERWRRREAAGDMIIVRYADDLIVGFEHETDARRFLDGTVVGCRVSEPRSLLSS